jgi:hypothetical protein
MTTANAAAMHAATCNRFWSEREIARPEDVATIKKSFFPADDHPPQQFRKFVNVGKFTAIVCGYQCRALRCDEQDRLPERGMVKEYRMEGI